MKANHIMCNAVWRRQQNIEYMYVLPDGRMLWLQRMNKREKTQKQKLYQRLCHNINRNMNAEISTQKSKNELNNSFMLIA